MAGLVPGIHAGTRHVFVGASLDVRRLGLYRHQSAEWRALYRVTSDIARRAYEHREGLVAGFTRRYGCKRLVWVERHEDIAVAIQREKNIKHWSRAWKAQMVIDANPAWIDLYDTLNQ